MGERYDKTVKMLNSINQKIKENIRRNIVLLGILGYLLIYTIWSLANFLMAGDISISLFWALLISSINLPFVITISIVLTGKWKGAIQDIEIERKLSRLDKELCLKRQMTEYEVKLKQQEIDFLKLSITQYQTIEELRREKIYIRDVSEYRCQLAARDGKVPDAICATADWNDSNEMIGKSEKLEQNKEEVKKEE